MCTCYGLFYTWWSECSQMPWFWEMSLGLHNSWKTIIILDCIVLHKDHFFSSELLSTSLLVIETWLFLLPCIRLPLPDFATEIIMLCMYLPNPSVLLFTQTWRKINWMHTFPMHINFAGPLNGSYYLVVVDNFSKLAEIFKCSKATFMVNDKFLTLAVC